VTDLAGTTAIVTGAASGIGFATASRLAGRGTAVTLVDVNDERGAAAATELGGTYVHLDVTQPDEWRSLLATFDRLDYLHLNAGVHDEDLSDLTTVSDARYRTYLGVNVDGVFFGLRAAIPALERAGGGVVMMASTAGLAPLPLNPVYAMTKWAVVGLVRSVHRTLAERGIRLNAVAPGAVATPMVDPDDPHAWWAERGITPLEPTDIAATVVDLLTGDGSGKVVLHETTGPPIAFEFGRMPRR
jgi:NAD(P)-dependent dehydrogenase (short-subunit alcohol dehydrogenase family)